MSIGVSGNTPIELQTVQAELLLPFAENDGSEPHDAMAAPNSPTMKQLDPSVPQAFSPWEPGLFSLGVFAALVAGLIAVVLLLTVWLNPRREDTDTAPYECGIIPTDPGRFRHPAPFYLVALDFLIFDLETVFIVTWALSFDELGLARWLQITVFILVLLASLVYAWGKGGLEWSASRRE